MVRHLTARERLAQLERLARRLEDRVPPRQAATIWDLPQAEVIARVYVNLQAVMDLEDDHSVQLRSLYALQLHALLPRGPGHPDGALLGEIRAAEEGAAGEPDPEFWRAVEPVPTTEGTAIPGIPLV